MSKVQITHTGMFSVSKVNGSNKLINLIKKHFNTIDLIITDATVNVGSDSINLALTFKSVNSIECDDAQYDVLKNNINVYNLKNVHLYKGNSLNLIPTLKQDIIYIDAPWGGSNYKNSQAVQLFLCKKELNEIYNENRKFSKMIIFKIPVNYDFNNFIQKTDIESYSIYPHINEANITKFYLMFCPTK